MAIFRRQAMRLLRKDWKDAQELAQEIVAIFLADEPVEIDSGIRVSNDTGGPPLVINNYVTNTQGNLPEPIVFSSNAPIPDTKVPSLPPLPPPPPSSPQPKLGRAYVGKVINKVGGQTYFCEISGDNNFQTNVTMLNLSPEATLPNGIYIPVIESSKFSSFVYFGFPCVFYPASST